MSEFLVDTDILELSSEWGKLSVSSLWWKSKDTILGVLSSLLELISGGVVDLTLLWLISSSWEQDQLGFILGKSLNVGGLGISVLVVSSVINSNSNGSSELLGQTSSSDLSEGEASAELDFATISSSLAKYNWSKLANWGSSKGSSSGGSSLSSKLFMSWLVEEALDSVLPMLSQVGTLKDIIVFYHVAY